MTLSQGHKRFITASILATFFWLTFFYCPAFVFSLVLAGILIAILFLEWTIIFKHNKLLFWLMMPLYPILPFMILLYMNHYPPYRDLLYYLFLIVFSFDTGAYITGTLFGNHKIWPSISPHKTFEGFLGGFISATIVFYLAIWEAEITVPHTFAITFLTMTCCVAFLGDLFESLLKRQARLKDSGNALPGHGGFLDRFDAVMMVTFFFFLLRNYLVTMLTK